MINLTLPTDHPHINGRVCSSCKEHKDADQYPLERDSRCVGGIAMRSTCRPCTEFRKYKASMKKRYNITYEQYEEMLEKQQHKCAICGSTDSQNVRTSGRLFIDHCHTTNKVRGLLCSKCNHALGQFNDDVGLLTVAINYLNTNRD